MAVDRYHTPDDGYRRMTAYLEANASFGTPIASTSATDAELLGGPADANLYCLDETNGGAPQPLRRCYGLQHPENGYTITDEALVTDESRDRTRVRDPQALLAGHPRYVIVATRLVDERYAVASPELVRWLHRNTKLVFSFNGPSDGTLEVFLVPKETP